jgi:outer membrane protein insertion porin family
MASTLPALVALLLAQPAPPAAEPPPADEAAATAPAAEEPGPPPAATGQVATRRYAIEAIVLRGLSHTRPEAVRRHLLVEEGELLDPDRVLLSRLALLQLGWFSRVDTHVERGSERGKVLVVFELVERNTLIVTDLIAGSTRAQPVYGGLGLSQQNFLGQGLGLSGSLVYGGAPEGRHGDPDRFSMRAGFFAPDLTVRRLRLVAGISGLFARGEEISCADAKCSDFRANLGAAPRLRFQRAGGELLLGIRPGPFERLTGSYRFERLRAAYLDLPADRGPYALEGWSTLAAVTAAYEIDTRDDFFYPTDGFRASGQVTFASRLFGGDYEFSRYLIQVETSYSFFHLPIRFQGVLGAVQGNAPFFERFYAADYAYFAIGPALGRAGELNFSTDSRYDVFLAMGGAEYGIPLWSRDNSPFHRAYLSLGVRGVWSSAKLGGRRTDFSRAPFSADAALRLDTSIGTFNISLGYALDNAL